MQNIVITSEDQAFEYLEKALQNDKTFENTGIEFNGWPSITLRLDGDGFENLILKTSTLKALLKIQETINQTYAALKYGNTGHRLTDHEIDQLSVVIKIEAGSSQFVIDLLKQVNQLLNTLAPNMSGNQLVVTVLGTFLIIAGAVVSNNLIESKTEERLAANISEERRASLLSSSEERKANAEISKEETKRLQIVVSAMEKAPRLEMVAEKTAEMQRESFKAISDSKTGEINRVSVSGDAAAELTKSTKRVAIAQRLDGDYKVVAVDSRDPNLFKVHVRVAKTGKEFIAKVQDETSNDRIKKALQHAEWSRELVKLTINAKLIGEDEVRNAIITDAKPFKP